MPLNICTQPISPVEERYVEEARIFAQERLKPFAEQWEQEKRQDVATLREAIGKFTKCFIAQTRGGLGLNKSTIVRILEELGKVDIGFALGFAVHNNVTWGVSQIADAEIREQYLPKMMTGEMIGGFLLTEPGAGTDAAAIKTRAHLEGDHWLVDGEKAWVTHAESADLFLAFAQSGEGPRDIVGFAVERSQPGLEFEGSYVLIGAHGMGAGAVRLNQCAIPSRYLVFPQGVGFKAAMGAIDVARLGIGALCNGALWGCLETAVDYLHDRTAFGKPLIQFQGLQWKLAEALTDLESSRALNFQAAKELE